jgi:hypothetical protein
MKRLIIIGILFIALATFGVMRASGIEIVFGREVGVTWDEVTADYGVITYEVMLAPYPYVEGSESVIGTVDSPGFDFTLDENGWIVGVRAVRTFQGYEMRSEVTWSHLDGDPAPFFLLYFDAPGAPGGVRISP